MPEASTLGLFIAASAVLVVVPGPTVLYAVDRSVEEGRSAGLASVLGIEIGALMHVAFAAAGLSAILTSSAVAFSVVKWLGAAYLIWLGLRRIFSHGSGETPTVVESERLTRVFSQGVLINVLNPKVALFFLAFHSSWTRRGARYGRR